MSQQWIIEKIHEEGGWISLERFMELSLHDPEHGYYGARISKLGLKGDFSTSATLSPALAKAIVATYLELCKQTGKTFPLLEIGGGDGSLAEAIRKELSFFQRRRLQYYIVDNSAPLQERQKERLGSFARQYSNMSDALNDCKGEAFIFSNELVDAFPARILQFGKEGWEEAGLSVYAKRLIEKNKILDQASLPDSSSLEYYARENQKIEILESYKKWCRTWHQYWTAGKMLTIDYGSTVDDIYYRRPWGTMRGYIAHRRITGPSVYDYAGRSDLTCDVNFTDLEKWGYENAWQTVSLQYQKDFLSPHSGDAKVDQFLNNPYGAGTAYRVLTQIPE